MNICDCAVNSYKSSDEWIDKHIKKRKLNMRFFDSHVTGFHRTESPMCRVVSCLSGYSQMMEV